MSHTSEVRTLVLPVLLGLLSSAFACTSEPPTESSGGSTAGDGDGDGDVSGGTSGKLDVEPGSSSGAVGGGGNVDPLEGEGCAMSSAQSKLTPVYLLFLLDQSASMGDSAVSYRERWEPATGAIKAFVNDEASAGIYASLTFFPNNANKTTGPGSSTFGITCDVDEYASPEVEAQLLPNLTPFDAAIAEVDPPNEWGTPTKVSYLGVSKYAESLLLQGNKVAIVLVTDGEPTGCDGDDDPDPFGSTLDAATALSDRAPTYVIGIGVTRFRLDQLAEAGGTDVAHIIDIEDPEQTREQLLSQVKRIQERQISCELQIPEPPDGESLDASRVNVQLSVSDEETTVFYNDDCEGGTGWRYDNPKDPEMISLCEQSCQTVQASNDGAVEVVFGCETEFIQIR